MIKMENIRFFEMFLDVANSCQRVFLAIQFFMISTKILKFGVQIFLHLQCIKKKKYKVLVSLISYETQEKI